MQKHAPCPARGGGFFYPPCAAPARSGTGGGQRRADGVTLQTQRKRLPLLALAPAASPEPAAVSVGSPHGPQNHLRTWTHPSQQSAGGGTSDAGQGGDGARRAPILAHHASRRGEYPGPGILKGRGSGLHTSTQPRQDPSEGGFTRPLKP